MRGHPSTLPPESRTGGAPSPQLCRWLCRTRSSPYWSHTEEEDKEDAEEAAAEEEAAPDEAEETQEVEVEAKADDEADDDEEDAEAEEAAVNDDAAPALPPGSDTRLSGY